MVYDSIINSIGNKSFYAPALGGLIFTCYPFAKIANLILNGKLLTAVRTDPKKDERVPFDLEVGLLADIGQFHIWNADIDIHDAMAFPAREVMVVRVPAGAVGMAPICEFNPVQ